MKYTLSDLKVLRNRRFKTWEEITEAVKERRLHLTRVLEERKDWFRIQEASGESWE